MNNLTLIFHITKLTHRSLSIHLIILLIFNPLQTEASCCNTSKLYNFYKLNVGFRDTSIKPNKQFPPRFTSSFRGMDICSDSSIWISGSKGVVLKAKTSHFTQLNNPLSFSQKLSSKESKIAHLSNSKLRNLNSYFSDISPVNFIHKDFRDIVAWDSNTALCMSIADSGVILKTVDGGRTWKTVYSDNSRGVFFDDIDFDESKQFGILAGDPLPNRKHLYFRFTFDSGNTWEIMPQSDWFKTNSKLSSMFAASGSSIDIINFKRIPSPEKIKTMDTTSKIQIENSNESKSSDLNKLMYEKIDPPVDAAVNRVKYQVDLIIGGGGDSGACIRFVNVKFERFWYQGKPYIHTYYQSFTDIPVFDSQQVGYGIYGFTTLKHDSDNFLVMAAGGHWKYPNRDENNAVIIEHRQVEKQKIHYWMYPFSGLAYNSGVDFNYEISPKNKPIKLEIMTVGTNGLKLDAFELRNTTKRTFPEIKPHVDTHTNSIQNAIQRNLNRVKFDGESYWIIGSNGQIYCISEYSK
jgi:hypothetical protein